MDVKKMQTGEVMVVYVCQPHTPNVSLPTLSPLVP